MLRSFANHTEKERCGTIFTMKHGRGRFKDWMSLVAAGWMSLVAAGCMALAAVCCGQSLCFCSDDPDGCGEECHVCEENQPDGVSAADTCDHLSLGFLDFWDEDGKVTVAGAGAFLVPPAWWPVAARNQILLPRHPTSCANAPPGISSDSVLFRMRRILLLS